MGDRPNIVLIAVDDLRPEAGCYGVNRVLTPTLDRLSERGVVFDRAYCQAPQCMPSRASLMTGVRPDANVHSRVNSILRSGEPTLPGFFASNGYRTVSIGKTYHWNDEDEASWTQKWRDTFFEQSYATHGYCSGYQLPENQRKVRNFHAQFERRMGRTERSSLLPPLSEAADAADDAYPDGRVSEIACSVLDDSAGSAEPLFLALGYYRPHLPWTAPQLYWDLYDRDAIELASNAYLPEDSRRRWDLVDFLHYGDEVVGATYAEVDAYSNDMPLLPPAKQRECIHGYLACVSFVDAQIGRVVNRLERLGKLDETIVVVYGDNGWHLGEHALWSKCTSFEESTRVPLIVAGGSVLGGARHRGIVELLDLYPTLADIAGLELPSHLDGESLLPALLGRPSSRKRHAVSRLRTFATVRTERYRYVEFYGESGAPEIELYDLLSDPGENRNAAMDAGRAAAIANLAGVLHELT